MTNEPERRLLLRLAREAIAAHVTGGRMAAQSGMGMPAHLLARPSGVFVSIHKHGDLRGCIGHIEATEPLGIVIPRCAVAACSADPRFSAVSETELPHLDVELSLLGPLEPIAGPDEFEIGRHGLVVEMGWHRGLLLPQVATGWNWDRQTFLAQTCHKAGLLRDAWKQEARVWKFEAEVFGESGGSGESGRSGG